MKPKERTIALVGNQNCGKTTLFNALTGSNARVGNYPGVTVERRYGRLLEADAVLTDLPGVYSLTPHTGEERITSDCLLRERPDVVINAADATTLGRGLYLTLELISGGFNVVLALTMTDELYGNGGAVDSDLLSRELGVPVVLVCAAKGEGLCELVSAALGACGKREAPREIAKPDERKIIECYERIDGILSRCVKQPSISKERRFSNSLDALLTSRFLAFPLLVLIVGAILFVTFGAPGEFLCSLAQGGVGALTHAADGLLTSVGVSPQLRSLVLDGAFAGIGGVIAFLPTVLLLFFLLSLLEDSGYMARAAFITDKPMRALGLSGRAFVPLITGLGCSVPALMSARTLQSERERKLTALVVPFVSCSAKLPIYAVLSRAFFPHSGAAPIVAVYVFGMLLGVAYARFFKNALFRTQSTSFLLELPVYRLPTFKAALAGMKRKALDFLKKAFTVIFLGSVAVWFLRSFDASFSYVADPSASLLASFGSAVAPVFEPLGFSDWRFTAALVSGLSSKEALVSTLCVLFASRGEALAAALAPLLTRAQAASLLTFTLLYSPCAAASFTLARELGGWVRGLLAVLTQTSIAWTAAYAVYRVALLLT